MKQVSIPIKLENKLNIKASADLFAEGSDSNILVSVVRESHTFRYTEASGKSEIRADSDCHLQIPSAIAVTIEKVGGDASVSKFQGRVIVGKIGGDLMIRNLGGASIESVGGDLHLDNPGADIEISRVGGDLYGKQIQSLSTRTVGGDVRLLKVNGKVTLTAGGDIDMELEPAELPELSITAGGDIRVIVQKDARGVLELQSRGQDIQVSAGGQVGNWEISQMSLPLGEGGNQLTIKAGGDIEVTDQVSMAEDFSEIINESASEWSTFGADLEKQIRENIGYAMENIKWATQTANISAEKARMKMDKAMHKLESKGVVIDHTGVNVEHDGKHVGITFGKPINRTEKAASRSTEEERMLVLKMLQEKKITAEEADQLLAALDH
jgi:hypothetical protein